MLLLALPLIACDKRPQASQAASAEAMDTAPLCAELCHKMSACGLEAAEKVARSGGELEQRALEQARADAPGRERECSEGCKLDKPKESDRRAIEATRACLAKRDCPALMGCLDALAQ